MHRLKTVLLAGLVLLTLSTAAQPHTCLTRAKKDGHWQIINQNGVIMPLPHPEKLAPAGNGLLYLHEGETHDPLKVTTPEFSAAYANGKTGLMNTQGETILLPQYDFMSRLANGWFWLNNGGTTWQRKMTSSVQVEGGKWGLAYERGKVLFEPQFDDLLYPLASGHFLMEKAGKYALWNPDPSAPPAFDLTGIVLLEKTQNRYLYKKNGTWHQSDGSPLPGSEKWQWKLSGTISGKSSRNGVPLLPVTHPDQPWYRLPLSYEEPVIILDSLGNIIYDAAKTAEWLAALGFTLSGTDSTTQLLNSQGQRIVEPGRNHFTPFTHDLIIWEQWREPISEFEYNSFQMTPMDDFGYPDDLPLGPPDPHQGLVRHLGLISPAGEILLEPLHDNLIFPSENPHIIHVIKDLKSAIYNLETRTLTAFKFKGIFDWEQGCAMAEYDHGNGIIDLEGNWLHKDSSYADWGYVDDGWLWYCNSNWEEDLDKVTGRSLSSDSVLIIPDNEWVFPGMAHFFRRNPKFASAEYAVKYLKGHPNRWRVFHEGKWGLVDGQGNWLLQPKYDEIRVCEGSNWVLLGLDELWGLAEVNGKVIAEPDYKRVRCPSCAGVPAKQTDDKWGVLDLEGEVVVPFEFQAIKDFIAQ